jgi:adenine-specific DNA-methyltransferase
MAAGKRKTESVERATPDLVDEQVERLKEIFPECVAEGKVDFERLKATLGEIVDERPERYSFTWAGKRDAIRLLQVPSRATLNPCPKESVDWETTKNVFIEGENLEALKLLYKSYAGRVKMIYIDPPYNTGNDFIYPDNFADPLDTYLKLTGQKDADGNLLTSNPETGGRYHSAWLSMMYPRLFVARQLLNENGVVFVSIDSRELSNLIKLLDELFGEENSLGCLIWRKKEGGGMADDYFATEHEYVVVYRKSDSFMWQDEAQEADEADFKRSDDRGQYNLVKLAKWGNTARREDRPSMYFPLTDPDGKPNYPVAPDGCEGRWRMGKERIKQLLKDDLIEWVRKDGKWFPYEKIYFDPQKGKAVKLRSILYDVGGTAAGSNELTGLFGKKDVFENPKPTALIKSFARWNLGDGELLLDFFAGSCTAAQAVLDLNREDPGNRRFVVVQLPEPTSEDSPAHKAGHDTIAEIAKERIRRVIKKLKDEAKGKKSLFKDRETPEDLGFRVFKLAESNYRQWRGVGERDGEMYAKEMDLFTDPLLPGWKPEDVIWEVALKEGYGLSSTVEEVQGIKGNRVWQVADHDRGQSFRICLDDKLKDATVVALKLSKDHLFVCRDVALTDQLAANLALQCRLKTI